MPIAEGFNRAEVLKNLESRRKTLGMPMSVMAKRSKLSLRTVQRAFSGKHGGISFDAVVRMVQALGGQFQMNWDPYLRAQTAKLKAKRLAALVQGTSALEDQAMRPDELSEITEQFTHNLLAGSRSGLWRE